MQNYVTHDIGNHNLPLDDSHGFVFIDWHEANKEPPSPKTREWTLTRECGILISSGVKQARNCTLAPPADLPYFCLNCKNCRKHSDHLGDPYNASVTKTTGFDVLENYKNMRENKKPELGAHPGVRLEATAATQEKVAATIAELRLLVADPTD
jgi:hypothetical protein